MHITANNTSFENPTYGQLKGLLPGTGSGRVPKHKEVLKDNPSLVISAATSHAVVSVYSNGFFTYRCGKNCTVQGVDRCEKEMRAFLNPEVAGSKDADIDSFSWFLPLEISGSARCEHNAESLDEDYRMFSINEDTDARNAELSHRPEHEMDEDALEEEKLLRELQKALERLTPIQQETIRIYYSDDKMTDQKVADILGTSQPNVFKNRKRALKKMKKVLSEWL